MEAQIAELREVVASSAPALSDEDILLMVGEQLNDLDLNIRSKLAGMKQNAARGRMLSEALNELNNQITRAAGDQGVSLDVGARFTYTDEGGARVQTTFEQVLRQFGVAVPAGAKLSETTIRDLRKAIEEKATSLRSEGETSQIELQQVMSRRSQLLQITSNVMASRNESRKAIAQNIRG